MNAIYKHYPKYGEMTIYTSLRQLRLALELTSDEVRRVFWNGVCHLSDGSSVIVYR